MAPKKMFEYPPQDSSSEEKVVGSDEEVEQEEDETARGKGEEVSDSKKKKNKKNKKKKNQIDTGSQPLSGKQDTRKLSAKVSGDEENGGGKKKDPKKLFERVWNDDDELVILNGMLAWHGKGRDLADLKKSNDKLGEFLDYIKESLSATVNKDQLYNKMRKLKKKFQNNFKRGKNGLDPVFSKPHDLKCYKLMKVIWAGQEVPPKRKASSSAADDNGKRSKQEIQGGILSGYPILAAAFRDGKSFHSVVGESFLEKGLAVLGDINVKEMENEWIRVQRAEAKVYLKRVDLIRKHTAMVSDAFKSSNS